jgi:flavin-dependent dehydrogenase
VAKAFDVLIIGGGPAGATAGRLLAQWGHSVAILAAPASRKPALAECLPPSDTKLFRFLGIAENIDHAGFIPTTGNTVWWAQKRRRVEMYPDGTGFQVLRSDFDRLLLELAEAAGAHVHVGKAISAGRHVELHSAGKRSRISGKFILDCSGRAGVIGRRFRVKEENSKTVALCCVWRNDKGWNLPDCSHTLVEAYSGGWAWSVPVSVTRRYVAFMLEPRRARIPDYQTELGNTRAFRRIFAHSVLEGSPWGCDASTYFARRYTGENFLLVGDAGSFIDPLSSFGVKKAMASAWMAAVVANTWLKQRGLRRAALEYFNKRETDVYARFKQQTATWFQKARGLYADPFWINRSDADSSGSRTARQNRLRRVLADLRATPALQLRRGSGVRLVKRPSIEGREIVLRDAVLGAAMDEPYDFIANVNAALLVDISAHHSQLPELFEAYNRTSRPVALPEFLTALATLLADGVLTYEAGEATSASGGR